MLNNYIFPLAILLGPRALLLRLVDDKLNECVHNFFCSVGRYDVVNYADTQFLQMFLCEWFWDSVAKTK